jgi:hypothetical protein
MTKPTSVKLYPDDWETILGALEFLADANKNRDWPAQREAARNALALRTAIVSQLRAIEARRQRNTADAYAHKPVAS